MNYCKLFLFFLTAAINVHLQASESMKYPIRQYKKSFEFDSPAIIYPARFRKKAENLKAAMGEKGIKGVILVEDKNAVKGYCKGIKDKWKKTPVLIIGNLEENEALLQLYSRFLTNADAVTPGKNGALIQFVPNRNSPGSHALIVAGSDQAGTEKAVDLLIEKIKNSKFCDWSKYVEFDLKGKAKQIAAKILKQGSGRYSKLENNLKNIYPLYQAYELSKEERFIESARKSLLATPENIWQAEGRDNHYGMGLPVRGWDGWARSGIFPPELVQQIDQIFLNYLVKWEKAWWRRKEDSSVFSDNRHHVYGTWGYWKTAEMLLRGLSEEQRKTKVGSFLKQKCMECERWFEACRKNYQQAALSTGVFINYTMFLLSAFQTGKTEIFEEGGALKIAELAIGAIDNTGGRAGISGYEDSYPGTVTPPYPVGAPVDISNYFYRKRELQWIRENLKGFSNETWWELSSDNHAYAIDLAPEYASSFLGFKNIFGTEKEPYFVSFRNGFKEDDLYLFITGDASCDINTGDSGKGRQIYPNMIARMSWFDTPWLIQNTNHKTAYHRNALLVDSSSCPTDVKRNMEVLYSSAKDNVYFFSARADEYMNTEWTRSYIIVKNSFMIIADEVKSKSTGDHSSVITWRSPFDAVAGNNKNEIVLRNNDKSLHIKSVSNHEMFTEFGRLDENEGALKPTVIRQYLSDKLQKSKSMKVFTLFYPSGNAEKRDYSIKQLASNTCLVKNNESGEIYLLGFGAFKNKSLDINSKAFMLNSKCFAAADNCKLKKNMNSDINLKKLWADKHCKVRKPNDSKDEIKAMWNFNGFDKIWTKLAGFNYSSENAKNLDYVFDSNIKRYKYASAPKRKPFEVSVDFEQSEFLAEVEVLSRSNGGKTKVEQALKTKSQPIEVYKYAGNKKEFITSSSEAFWKLDESYKGEVYTYTGSKAFLGEKARRFQILSQMPHVYQVNLYGGKKIFPGISNVSFLRIQSLKYILVQSKSTELACIGADDGKLLWKKKFPEILDIAIGDINKDGIDDIGLACMDKSIKRIDPESGKILWTCSTWPVRLGLPYSIDLYNSENNNGFIFSSYYHMNIVDMNGTLIAPKQKILPGMWLYNIMSGSLDLNGDGYGDAISRALWGHVNLYDGKTGKVDYFANLKGRLVDWKIIKGRDKKPDLFVLTKDGMGLYDAHIRKEFLHEGFPGAPDEDALLLEKRSQREIWSKRFESTSVGFVEIDGKLIIAHVTGFVSVYSLDGEFTKKIFVDRTIKNINTVKIKDEALILLNSGRKLIVLSSDLKKLKEYDISLKNIYVLDEEILIAVDNENVLKRIKINL